MGEYILLLSCVSVFCGIIHILAPKGEGEGLRENVRFVGALALLCVALLPISEMISGVGDAEIALSDIFEREELEVEYEESFCEAVREYSELEAERVCENILFERFGLGAGDIEVDIFSCVENDKIKTERADILIYFGGITQNPVELSETISELLDCECRIIYK